MTTVLITGASGYVGGRLARHLAEGGDAPSDGAADGAADAGELRLMMRRPDPAKAPAGARVVRGDAVSGDGLAEALDGVDVAYYLIHSMGRGGDADFAERDRRAADTFGRAATAAGVSRVIYLGGLSNDEDATSDHLRSRDEVAQVLERHVPGLVHVRAAMVLGAGGASFEMLRALVHRLPAMICPRWIDTRTQPIAIDDVVATLAALRDRPDVTGEVQLGGPEVLSYLEMMQRTADAMGRRRPLVIRVPVLSPRLSSYWVTLVTPVESALVRPLVDGLREEMIVRRPPPPGVNDHPRDFDAAVRAALAES